MKEAPKIRRRVYVPEMTARTGYGSTWLRVLEKTGRIPPSRTDPDAKRKFWFDDEAAAIVEGIPQRAAASRRGRAA